MFQAGTGGLASDANAVSHRLGCTLSNIVLYQNNNKCKELQYDITHVWPYPLYDSMVIN